MDNFTYEAPRSLDDAYALLSNGRSTRLLAGGTDLIIQLREDRDHCEQLVDIKHIPELMQLAVEDDGSAVIGAAVPCARIYEHEEIGRRFPALIDSASLIGGIQIQGRASLGGNLCNASPAADSAGSLIVLDARLTIGSARGIRELPVADFFRGPGENALGEGEILLRIMVPVQPPRSGAHYLRFIPRNEMDIAVASAGARLVLDEQGERIEAARLAAGAVAPTPLVAAAAAEFLAGKEPTDDNFRRAGELAAEASSPITDMRGSAAQRRHLTAVLTRRALEGALARAREA
ncbi:MAG: FAD binding domain-containing protein [Dehalococcoidia bacterium]